MVSALLRTISSSSKAFHVASPAFKDGITDNIGYVRIVIVLVAAYFKNSSSNTLRNNTSLGINSTILQFLSSLILGKYTVTK